MSRPVHIAGRGLICARGSSPAAVADALWSGECTSGSQRLGERSFPFFGLPLAETDWLERAQAAMHCVAGQLGPLDGDIPLFVASSSFQIGDFEQRGVPFDLPPASASFSRQIADWLGLTGPRYSFSNACISGFSAIDAARTLIGSGRIDQALVLGVELANRSTLAGFAGMELLSRTQCRPFDARRDGLVLGEAVAAIHLTAAPTEWRIAGLRTGIDAYSTTGPDPEGGPIATLIRECLGEAGLEPDAIDLIKLQAAGSPGTDLAEAHALRTVFERSMPPLLSLKPNLGHTLGASGIVELVALLASLAADQVPSTAGFKQPDPAIGLEPTRDRQTLRVRRALLNLIGFGGGLASLVVERQ